MGISIHYKGKIREKESLPLLIEEIKDISETYGWEYFVFEKEFPAEIITKRCFSKELYGITFSPPESESISMCFLPNGELVGVLTWHVVVNEGHIKSADNEWVSVKTQFAGHEMHKIVIHMIDYLSKKYLDSFELDDESGYWKDRDEKLIENNFNYLAGLIKGLGNAFENGERRPGESLEDFITRMSKEIDPKRKK